MAAHITGAEAIHPGYGYLSERASFAEACAMQGIKFIGPTPEAIAKMGDKSLARAIAHRAGAPVLPGTERALQSEDEAVAAAHAIGFPLLIKAAAGGGGRGIRRVMSEDDLLPALRIAQSEAQAAFGSPEVYLEKYIPEPRHIEVQILADEHGKVLHLFERECSIQNPRHQKMIEEAPAPNLRPETRRALGDAAVKVAQAVGYQNAGTIEFLVDADENFYFIEMNTRLQVEHPVTEAITGIDIVQWQIRIAAGEPLPFEQADIAISGHAIEARLTAEIPEQDFTPSTGRTQRVDTAWRSRRARRQPPLHGLQHPAVLRPATGEDYRACAHARTGSGAFAAHLARDAHRRRADLSRVPTQDCAD
jgi:acetyl-CoA carboxylase, biotin carboxylase subunit